MSCEEKQKQKNPKCAVYFIYLIELMTLNLFQNLDDMTHIISEVNFPEFFQINTIL